MSRVILAVVALAVVAIALAVATRSPPRLAGPDASSVRSPSADRLKRTLQTLQAETISQESGKDATCWTTVRMMDAHFTGRQVPDPIALLKIEACKTLVYDVWRSASARTPANATLGGDDVVEPLPSALRDAVALMVAVDPQFGGDPVRSVMNRDYHRVTENKRYLHAIIAEAIEGVGLFEQRAVDLKPLSESGIRSLAAVATVITTDFLTACATSAQEREHRAIDDEDVRQAFAHVLATLGPTADAAAAGPSSASAPVGAVRSERGPVADIELLADTRRAIAGKIAALRSWNAKVWSDATDPEQRQMELVNRMTKVGFDRESFAAIEAKLVHYVDYLARGVAPMQHNAFWTPVNGQILHQPPPFAERRPYIDLAWAANALENLFPRSIAANGDVTIEIMGNPGVPVAIRHERMQLLDWELDALRDTTLHWSLIESAWKSSEARPADPFALELLADRMSELALLFIRTADEAAVRQLRPRITEKICNNMLMDVQFAVPPRENAAWAAAEIAGKSRVLATYPGHLFTDASDASGLPAVAAVAREGFGAKGSEKRVVQAITLTGSGVAVGDFDGDGLPDLFLPGDGGNRLLRNLGGRRFEDVTAARGIADEGVLDAHHALFVDYDNDGRLDLFVVHSEKPSRLFHQEADGRFTDVTASCGIATGEAAHDAVFFDYDDDGLLDCYVGHYGVINPSLDGRNGGKNRLFHNLGGGRFADVTDRAGVGSTGWTLASAAIDVDHDGRMDLFVANDYGRCELFINQGDGTFVDRARSFGVDDRGSSMNASVVDLDDDGWMDLYITQIDMFSKSLGWVFPQADSQITINKRILASTFYISGNKLFHNDHGRRFVSVDERMVEPGDRGWSWSGNFLDVDNDGDEDMYLTNGWVADTPAANQANQFFVRDGGRFYLADASGPESYVGNSRGAAAADLTGSGRIDVIVNDYGARPRLLANACANDNHYVKVRLRGTRSNRFGIGAVVRLARDGGASSAKQVNCGANYLSQDETTLTFGLGASASAPELTVVWPGNHEQRVRGPLKAGAIIDVVEEDGAKAGTKDD